MNNVAGINDIVGVVIAILILMCFPILNLILACKLFKRTILLERKLRRLDSTLTTGEMDKI